MAKESDIQKQFIDEIKERFPGAIVLKNDASYLQGVPDLLILHNRCWGALEVKKDSKAKHQPNQDYYVDIMDRMSFSRFVYPENKDIVFDEMEKIFNEKKGSD